MTKTARDVIVFAIADRPRETTNGQMADFVLANLAAAGFVIVPKDAVNSLRVALEPFVRGLNMHESGACVTEDLPMPKDEEPAKNVYVGDQRRARAALRQHK